MSKMIQIRNVPDRLHRRLKARAASSGMSLSDYLLKEIKHFADLPTIEEMGERIREREAISSRLDAVREVRRLRDKD